VVTTGTFFPRVAALKSSTTPWCEFCEVREACVRDDSTLKRQFLEALDSTVVTPTQRARRQLWTMGRDDE